MPITYDFTDRVAFVTGAASGMGLATARAFAAAGAATVLVDLPGHGLDAAVAALAQDGRTALAIGADVTEAAQVSHAIDEAVRNYGRLDMAFNNAGIIAAPSEIADASIETFDRVTAVNLRGIWLSLKYELAHMRRQGFGSVVNCSSIAGVVGAASRSEYASAKHGVVGMTKSVALESGRYGVRVNAVCPGTIVTPMVDRMAAGSELDLQSSASATALGRLGRPEEIADAVLWLSSDASSYVTGVALSVDGGLAAA